MRRAWLSIGMLSATLCTLAGSAPAGSAPAPRAPGHPAPAAPVTTQHGSPSPRGKPSGAGTHAIIPAGRPPAILPLSEVRVGMVGEALTVFKGTKPEPFKVRVVSIMRQFLPRQDVILIRAEDPRLEFSGIVAGMSGSPVYVDGKLMGAIAYAWSFSKEPLGGVTPIESMLAERARPRRSKSELASEAGPDGLRVLTIAEGGPGSAGAALSTVWPASETRAAAPPPVPVASSEGHLVRVAVPLSASGFHPRVLAEATREFQAEGLIPVQAAGGGKRRNPSEPGRVEPGSAIGVELIRGDMSLVGTGTVTYVDRDSVLAFGHPMFGAGEIYLPLVDAEIHAILPSVSQSMKLSSPLHEVGTLVQDRAPCIIGDLGARTSMVPVNVRVTAPGAPTRTFRAEVARNRRLTPMLASLVIGNALTDAEPDAADMVVKVDSTIVLGGRAPLQLRDEIFSPEGVSRSSLAGTRGVRAVADLLSNPFEPVLLQRLDFDVGVEYRRNVAEIIGVSLPGGAIHPGETVRLRVTMRPYAGPEIVQTVPVIIPRALGGDVARIEVASGASAKPDTPQPETLAIYLDNLTKYYPPSSIVISVQTPDEGAGLRGRVLSDLPSAAADTLRPGGQTRRADAFRVAERTVVPSKHLLFGRQEISVIVRDDAVVAEPRVP